MSDPVKSTRVYDSPRRREQAAGTRRAILAAAQRLFVEDGYGATTVAAIAAEARVALKTVYVAFETKSGVLRALWNLLLREDEDSAPVAQREWYLEVLNEPDPERQLRLNARNARAVKERAGKVLGVIRSAAPLDADIAALWGRIETDFYENQRAIVERLAQKEALRPGLDVTKATDILWTLNHPDVWLLLVGERGWTPDQFEGWFADTICRQLLPDRTRQKTRPRPSAEPTARQRKD
jgi:AcrR family transcriptional regulator